MLYVSRAQKKAEREEFLRRQFEERRKERMMKYQVVHSNFSLYGSVYHLSFLHFLFLIMLVYNMFRVQMFILRILMMESAMMICVNSSVLVAQLLLQKLCEMKKE